jgi:hypothetical protein
MLNSPSAGLSGVSGSWEPRAIVGFLQMGCNYHSRVTVPYYRLEVKDVPLEYEYRGSQIVAM